MRRWRRVYSSGMEAFSMNIPVVLYNKDPRLEEEAFSTGAGWSLPMI